MPSVVFGTVFASVVPACVLGACGGDDSQGNSQDAAFGHEFSVAEIGFTSEFSVDTACFACDAMPDAARDASRIDASDAGLDVADGSLTDSADVAIDAPTDGPPDGDGAG